MVKIQENNLATRAELAKTVYRVRGVVVETAVASDIFGERLYVDESTIESLAATEATIENLNGVDTSRQRIPYVGRQMGTVSVVSDADVTLPVPSTLSDNGMPQSTELLQNDDGTISDLYITKWTYPQKIRVILNEVDYETRLNYQFPYWFNADGVNTTLGFDTGVGVDNGIIFPDYNFGYEQYDRLSFETQYPYSIWFNGPPRKEGIFSMTPSPLMLDSVQRASCGQYEFTTAAQFSWNSNWSQTMHVDERYDENWNCVHVITGFDLEWVGDEPNVAFDVRIKFLTSNQI